MIRVVLLLVGLLASVWGQIPERLIYVTIEGVSQRTLIGLKNKDKLPGIKEVVSQGNVRNMNVNLDRISYESTMVPLITGRKYNENEKLERDDVWFDALLRHSPKLRVYAVLSQTQNPEAEQDIQDLLPEEWPKRVKVRYLTKSSPVEVVAEALKMIPKRQSQYVVWLNFTQVDAAGHRYREGSAKYSKALRKVDVALGRLFDELKERQQWEGTRVIGVTNYGFDTKSQLYQTHNRAWILANKKVMRKGNLLDVVPSIWAEWGVGDDDYMSLFERHEDTLD